MKAAYVPVGIGGLVVLDVVVLVVVVIRIFFKRFTMTKWCNC